MSNNLMIIDSPEEWKLLEHQCKTFIQSGFLPSNINSVSKAITILMKGRELGIPPMQAFSSISIVQGKPCLSAELMLGLIYQRVPGSQVNFIETTNEKAVVEMTRPGGKTQTFTFTMEDAKRANISSKAVWKQYPKTMLRWRVISAGAKAVFPDAIMGCYIPEELGASVEVNDIGDVLVVEESTKTAKNTSDLNDRLKLTGQQPQNETSTMSAKTPAQSAEPIKPEMKESIKKAVKDMGLKMREPDNPPPTKTKKMEGHPPGEFQIKDGWGQHGGRKLKDINPTVAKAYLPLIEKKAETDEYANVVATWLRLYVAEIDRKK